jgi:zinc ribbon protein
LLFCPNCGETYRGGAKFCPNCGVALGGAGTGEPLTAAGAATRRPVLAFVLSVVASLGLIAVALSMSFVDDAPGYVGSPAAALFRAVGTVQLIVGLAVLIAALLMLTSGATAMPWGSAILCLGLASIAAQLVIVLEGTFAVILLGIPGLVAVVAGFLARRTAHRP